MCTHRFDNGTYTRLQFLRAVSHVVGSEKMLSDSQSDAGDDDVDTKDEDDRTKAQTAANTSDDAGTPSTVSAAAVDDSFEVCFVVTRDTRYALVPCGHQRFCASCANAVHEQSLGCPLCRTAITKVLRLY